MLRQLSSEDDQGRKGGQPLTSTSAGDASLSSKIKYAANVQDVASNVCGQISTVGAMGVQLGANLPEFQQDTDYLLLEDQEIGAGASVFIGLIASFIWFIKNRRNSKKKTESYDKIRTSLNPWYRRFKTAMALGNNVGSSAVEACLLFLPLPLWVKKPLKLALGYLVGLIFGVIGATLFKGDLTQDSHSIFKFGRDGWSKYAKAGVLPGSLIGAAIGAVIGFLLPIPGGMALGIALGTGLGGIIGFLSFTFIIPLWNKITGKNAAGEKYRSQYIRTGTTLGMFLGTILGFVVGLILPFPGASILCATVGAGIGAAVGSLVLGILGPRISRKINPEDKSYSSWDYGARSGLMFGNQFGLGSILTGFLNWFNIGTDHKNLKDVTASVGGLLGGAIGCAYDVWCGVKNRNLSKEKFEAGRPVLSWSDRVRTFITLGGFVGGIIGFIIGTVLGGPIGAPIGLAIGTGLGGVISGAIGAKWGEQIYKGFFGLAKSIGDYFSPPDERNAEPAPVPITPSSSASLLTSSQEYSEEEIMDSPLTTTAKLQEKMPAVEDKPIPIPVPAIPISTTSLSHSPRVFKPTNSSHNLAINPLISVEPEPGLVY